MNKPTLVIMAAGLGSRYGGLKQMDPVGPNGELILDYSIYDALQVGFEKVVFVIKESIEADFKVKIGHKIEGQCEVAYVLQDVSQVPPGFQVPTNRVKPWGTGHAVLTCKPVVDNPLAVINADDFYGRDSFQVLQNFLAAAQNQNGVYSYAMVGFKIENTLTDHGHVARGVCEVDTNGDLRHIKERTHIEKSINGARFTEDDGASWTKIPAGSFVSLNTWGFTPSIFDELERAFPIFLQTNQNLEKAEFFLPDIVGDLLKTGTARVKVLPTEERWVGVTYQADKPVVEQYIAGLIHSGLYPDKLWE
jgi:UTP-glucose-1-phosphate uridylyltransferase